LGAARANVSPESWQHIYLQSEFNFSDETLTDMLRFNLNALHAVD